MVERKWNLDVLRILSMAAVVVIHTAAQYWSGIDVHGADWRILNFYDGAARWSVPVFVMISGALFLDPSREQSIHKLYTKNILRILLILLFWGLIYTIIYNRPTELSLNSFYDFFKGWILGHYHMWFLYMIIGLYMITPLIRCIVRSESLTKYFLLLGLIFTTAIPFITSFGHMSILNNLVQKVSWHFPMGFVVYYVLGYWLNSHDFSKMHSAVFAIIGLVGVGMTIGLTDFLSQNASASIDTFYNYTSLPVVLASIGVFMLGTRIQVNGKKAQKVVLVLSAASLGVYMVHGLVLDALQHFGIDSMMFDPLFAAPLTAASVILASFAISVLLGKIPIIGKYLV